MRKIYLTVYLAVLGVGTLSVILAAAATHWLRDANRELPRHAREMVALFLRELPDEPDAFAEELARRADAFDLDVTLWSPDGAVVVSTGPVLGEAREGDGYLRHNGRLGVRVTLDDGRVIAGVPRHGTPPWRRPRGLLFLGMLLLAVAAGSYPVARRITRRIETLQRGVEGLGQGRLGTRVSVDGRDEVAQLATSFNEAAERIEQLVTTQKRLLASASHELRSPLARVRMALELLQDVDPALDETRSQVVRDAVGDVEELDALVGDLLAAARLERGGSSALREATFELSAVVSDEAERVGAVFESPTMRIRGDERLLRRLVRNLLENARRYGAGSPIDATLSTDDTGIRLMVADRGPGVAPEDRERIFEAFYRPDDHHEARDGGVGLGLSLVREIARAHGGRVTYADRDGGGSCFALWLPAERRIEAPGN